MFPTKIIQNRSIQANITQQLLKITCRMTEMFNGLGLKFIHITSGGQRRIASVVLPNLFFSIPILFMQSCFFHICIATLQPLTIVRFPKRKVP